MRDTDPNVHKFKELVKEKRRLLNTMRKHRKSLAKARVDKKRVNEEITRLRKSGFAFAGMTPSAAAARVSDEIKSVEPRDIYPNDLEKKFDKLERTTEVKYRNGSVDITDIDNDDAPARSAGNDDDGVYAITLDPENGVLDLGEGEEDQADAEPENEDAD